MAEKVTEAKKETPKPSEAYRGMEIVLERIATSLERLADAFAPVARKTTPGRPLARTCEVGHGMQPTDDYCQECKRLEKAPRVTLDELRSATIPDEVA